MKLKEIRKAALAAAVAFTGAGATAAADGSITTAEWWVVASATVVALAGVWRIENADARRGPRGGGRAG